MAKITIITAAIATRTGGKHNDHVKDVCEQVVAGMIKKEEARKAVEKLVGAETEGKVKNAASRIPQMAATALRNGILTPEEAQVAISAILGGQAARLLGAEYEDKVKLLVDGKVVVLKDFNAGQEATAG